MTGSPTCVSLAIGAALLLLAALPTEVAGAHGKQLWMEPYRNGAGTKCCGPEDVAFVPQWVAGPAEVGSEIFADFGHHDLVKIVVSAVHPTEDPHGRAWITLYGCLFKMFGV